MINFASVDQSPRFFDPEPHKLKDVGNDGMHYDCPVIEALNSWHDDIPTFGELHALIHRHYPEYAGEV